MPNNSCQRTTIGRHRFWILGAVALVFVVAIPSLASFESILNFYREGRYDEARQVLTSDTENSRPGEDLLWRSRLATDPEQALALLKSHFDDPRLPTTVGIRLRLDAADVEFGRRNYAEVLELLEPLLTDDSGHVPGEVHLLAGLSLRAVGNLQRAREMLASVRPGDAAFEIARHYLGAIGLEQRDPVLALRYFESAARDEDPAAELRTAGGRWKALLAADRAEEADALLASLRREHPQSLALLEINGVLQEEADDLAARTATAVPDTMQTVARPDDEATGRYAVQLGAFNDRALALDFQRRFEAEVSDLRIDQVTDERGQFLYKVRVGFFVNPALARAEAQRLERRLNLDAFVVDIAD